MQKSPVTLMQTEHAHHQMGDPLLDTHWSKYDLIEKLEK